MVYLTNTMDIKEKDFCIKRTTRELCDFVRQVKRSVRSDPELYTSANQRRGPYERFVKELRPFAHYCRVKYGLDSDVLCYLTNTEAGDAYVENPDTGRKRLFEITWAIDGQQLAKKKKRRLKGECDEGTLFAYDDVTLQEAAVDRALKNAKQKARKDYSNPDGSTLIFVFNTELFWDDNERHKQLLEGLVSKLGEISFRVNEVEVLFLFGDRAEIKPVHGQEKR